MANLKHIKLKIQSYKKTGTVTRAMQAVSAVKMRKSQERAIAGRTYASAALSVLERLSGSAEAAHHPLLQSQEGKACYIVVTSDKGLAGSLNSAVIKKVEADIAERGLHRDEVVMIAIGRRGGDYFASRRYDVRVKRENISDSVTEAEMREITNTVLTWYTEGEIGTCAMAYTTFVSTFEQNAVLRNVMLITTEMIERTIADITPKTGKYSQIPRDRHMKQTNYTIEPDADSVLAVLLPRLMNIAVFHALLEAKASEHSARMVAMKSATDKAHEMTANLTRTFNKVRQAAITREVSEIVGGIEAMR